MPLSVEKELAKVGKEDKQIVVVIPLADHTTIDQGRLRRRNWFDFKRTVDNFMKKSPNAADGVIITPLAVVEYLRQEI